MSDNKRLDRINKSSTACWVALACLVVPMFASYFFDDMFSTLSHIFQNPEMLQLGWDSADYGFYAGGGDEKRFVSYDVPVLDERLPLHEGKTEIKCLYIREILAVRSIFLIVVDRLAVQPQEFLHIGNGRNAVAAFLDLSHEQIPALAHGFNRYERRRHGTITEDVTVSHDTEMLEKFASGAGRRSIVRLTSVP